MRTFDRRELLKLSGAAGASALAATWLAACGGAPGPGGGNKPSVKIGLHLPLSGPAAFDAQNHLNGHLLAVKLRNQAGGILGGRQIETVVYDDKGVPEEGVTAVNKLISQDHVSAITGTFLSSIALAVLPVVQQKNMLIDVSNATDPRITAAGYKYLFRCNSTNDQRADFYAKFVVEKVHPKTVYMTAVDQDYGRAEISAYTTRWKTLTGAPQILTTEYFAADLTDFTVLINKIKQSKAEAAWMSSPSSPQNANWVKQTKAAGFGSPGQPYILGPAGNWTNDFLKLVGHDADGTYTMETYLIDLPYDENKQFVAAYVKEYPQAPAPSQYEPMGYNAMNILLQAMDEAGGDTAYDKIMTVVKSKTWKTPYGDATFDSSGQINIPQHGVQVRDAKFVAL